MGSITLEGEDSAPTSPELGFSATQAWSLCQHEGVSWTLSRSMSLPTIRRRSSFGLRKGTLEAVTAHHPARDIDTALQLCKNEVSRRLQDFNMNLCSDGASASGEVPLRHPVAGGGDADTPGSPSHAESVMAVDVDFLQLELHDREQQILQTVELGQGLLRQLEEERERSREREEELGKEYQAMVAEVHQLHKLLCKYKAVAQYYSGVERELSEVTQENEMLHESMRGMGSALQDRDYLRWIEDNLRQADSMLEKRQQAAEALAKEVEDREQRVDKWARQAARAAKLQERVDHLELEKEELRQHVRQLKRVVQERDSRIYNLTEQLSNRSDQWKLESLQAAVLRLKRDHLRLSSELEQQRERAAVAEDDAKRLRLQLDRLARHDCSQAQERLAEMTHAFLEEVRAAKDEAFHEFEVWNSALTDVARTNRNLEKAVRRLKEDNNALREHIAAWEVHDQHEEQRATPRSQLVNTVQAIFKGLVHVKDFAKATKGLASNRPCHSVTEKEVGELHAKIASVAQQFHYLLHHLLSPNEKLRAGVSLDMPEGAKTLFNKPDGAPLSRSSSARGGFDEASYKPRHAASAQGTATKRRAAPRSLPV